MIRKLLRKLRKKEGKCPGGAVQQRTLTGGTKRSLAEERIAQYLEGGRVPWSVGYHEYKWKFIAEALSDIDACRAIADEALPEGYGIGLDERVVEYPWILPLLINSPGPILDAGSVLNFDSIVGHPLIDPSSLTIAGLAVEKQCHYASGVSYQLCDLRDLPFRDHWFETTICVSTLEHIGMNNEIYGHEDETAARDEAAKGQYLDAVRELVRVTKPDGVIAITVPVGKFENHGFFQQFDRGMIDSLVKTLGTFGRVSERYFRYHLKGWTAASWEECKDSYSYNPHTGKGIGEDGAAHCRAVGCFLAKA